MKEENFLTLSSGRQLCYAEYGDPGGRPVLYFHGWPSSRLQGRMLHQAGLEHRTRIIAPDRPGVGKSDFHRGRRLLDWPPIVQELINHLKLDRVSVLGVSGGGPYVIACASALPERIEQADIVCGAVPLVSFPDKSAMMWPYRALLWLRPRAPHLFSPLLKLSEFISLVPSHRPPLCWFVRLTGGPDREILLSENVSNFTESFREGLAGGARGIMSDGDIYNSEWRIDFSTITFPVHFWHGEQDNNIPYPMAKEYASWIPGATFTGFPEHGHYSIAVMLTEQLLSPERH